MTDERMPYPHLSDAELDEAIRSQADAEPVGMVITDLSAWESAEYDAWCEQMEQDRRGRAA